MCSLRTQSNSGDSCAVGAASTQALTGIPAGASIVAAYLYWGGSGGAVDASVTLNGQAVAAQRTFTATFNNAGTSFPYFGGFADITARILELLGYEGWDVKHPQVKDALRYIREEQEEDGSWYGRWGVNYIYGTWQVLVGLTANGIPASDPRLQKAVGWLKAKQQSCGGWGETARSYDDPSLRGTGIPTASQTAWALLGLIAAGEADSLAVQRGVDYLLNTQQPNGTWTETEFTGTGFPRVFYLKYHYYALYFPLMALARYAKTTGERA